MGQSILRDREIPFGKRFFNLLDNLVYRKGIRLKFLNQDVDIYGNINELGDIGKNPRKSSLFFLIIFYPGINLLGDRVL